jgi:CRP-like cAMP-binding protein
MIGDVMIKRLGLIGQLAEEDREALLSIAGEERDLQPGEDILTDGQRPTFSVIVLAGLLQRYTLGPGGGRQIHSFYLPNDTPSLEAIHIGRMDNNLGAVAPSRVGIVPFSELHRVMNARPNVLALIWRETLVQASMLRSWLMRNSQMLAHAQMAHLFCEMMLRSKAYGLVEGDSCNLPVTEDDLACALGMSTVHVTRTLMLLRSAGLAEFRDGGLTVRDTEKLAELAAFDPTYLHLEQR